MQTFNTHTTYPRTMAHLDKQRLGKQRLETWQILRLLRGETKNNWTNHPAVKMWRGFEPSLVMYGFYVCHEWRIVRGYEDEMWGRFATYAREYGMLDTYANDSKTALYANGREPVTPPWLSDLWVLRSHRSNLMRKDPKFYSVYRGTPENMPYLWPLIDDGEYTLTLSRADAARLRTGERELPPELRADGLMVYA
jgi:hypothetical protein